MKHTGPMSNLKQRATLFADMAQGGYLQNYDIIDGDKVVGQKVVSRQNRKCPEVVQYFLGAAEFDNAHAFLRAYEEQKT